MVKIYAELKNQTKTKKICCEARKETQEAVDSQKQTHFPVTVPGVN